MLIVSFSHRKWRSLLKQKKRKLIRQRIAKENQEINEEDNEEEAVDSIDIEQEQERLIQHELWLERERTAQALFLAKKDREEKERLRREEEERKLKEEWEERQKKEKEEEEQRKKVEDEKKTRQEELLKKATANERKADSDGVWHNPIAPAGYSADAPEKPICEFYSKTGVCRFREGCSRSHNLSLDDSCTLLFPGMYSHFELEQSMRDEYDTDLTLEFEDSDIYQHFEAFYSDVLPEFKAIGRVVQFKVCCNYQPHLRGNVYVQYHSRSEALDAYGKFNGRWYAGRQLSCQFTCVIRWKQAICGLFHQRKCPKGKQCNFLHVFRNPGNEFREADADIYRLSSTPYQSSYRYDPRRRRPYDSFRSTRFGLTSSSRSSSSSRIRQSDSRSRHRISTRSRSRSSSRSRRRSDRRRSASRSPSPHHRSRHRRSNHRHPEKKRKRSPSTSSKQKSPDAAEGKGRGYSSTDSSNDDDDENDVSRSKSAAAAETENETESNGKRAASSLGRPAVDAADVGSDEQNVSLSTINDAADTVVVDETFEKSTRDAKVHRSRHKERKSHKHKKRKRRHSRSATSPRAAQTEGDDDNAASGKPDV